LESLKMDLEKDLKVSRDQLAESLDQIKDTLKAKEDVQQRLTALEDNYQKGEMLREQFKLKLQQSAQNIERQEQVVQATSDKLESSQ